jgi:hypothetical protein
MIRFIKRYENIVPIKPKFKTCKYCCKLVTNFFSDYHSNCEPSCKKCGKASFTIRFIATHPLSVTNLLGTLFGTISAGPINRFNYYQNWCSKCALYDFAIRIIQCKWREYKNRQRSWKHKTIERFVSKMVKYNNNETALCQALISSSRVFDVKTVAKMQSVINIYKEVM